MWLGFYRPQETYPGLRTKHSKFYSFASSVDQDFAELDKQMTPFKHLYVLFWDVYDVVYYDNDIL